MLARVAQVLGRHGISIASVLQKEDAGGRARAGGHRDAHGARRSEFQAALGEIDALDVVGAPTVRLRIEDF